MTSVITSRKSKGPLGYRGCGMYEDLGYCPAGLYGPRGVEHVIERPKVVHVSTFLKRSSHANCNEAYRKPEHFGKALGEKRDLKPDWGNPTVRDFRGGEGNGGALCKGLNTLALHPPRPLSTRPPRS